MRMEYAAYRCILIHTGYSTLGTDHSASTFAVYVCLVQSCQRHIQRPHGKVGELLRHCTLRCSELIYVASQCSQCALNSITGISPVRGEETFHTAHLLTARQRTRQKHAAGGRALYLITAWGDANRRESRVALLTRRSVTASETKLCLYWLVELPRERELLVVQPCRTSGRHPMCR
jgi:hypothetical protein